MVSSKAPEPSFLWPSCMGIKPSVAWIFLSPMVVYWFPKEQDNTTLPGYQPRAEDRIHHCSESSRDSTANRKGGEYPALLTSRSSSKVRPTEPADRYGVGENPAPSSGASISCHEREGCLPLTPRKSSSRGGLVKQLIPEDVRNLRIQESWGLRYRPG